MDPRTTLRVRAKSDTRREAIEEKEEEKKKEVKIQIIDRRYVRRRECLGRPFQSGDNGARSVYTFWNFTSRFISRTRTLSIIREMIR